MDLVWLGQPAVAITITPDGSRVYAASGIPSVISVIDTETNQVVDEIRGLGGSSSAIAITPDGKKAPIYMENRT